MKTQYRIPWIIGIIALLWGTMDANASGLPPGVSLRNGYLPSNKAQVGVVQRVQGEVFIIHSRDKSAYQAKKTFDIFEDDTLITGEGGKISFKLNDGSILSLRNNTRLVINQSIYDPDKQIRSSFFRMTVGKARFWVRKFTGFKQSDFQVETKTAVVGVRGSDFVVEATDRYTWVRSLEKTDLVVVSRIRPDQPSSRVTDFEEVLIMENALPSPAEEMTPEAVERIKQEYVIPEAWKESNEPNQPPIVSIDADGWTPELAGEADLDPDPEIHGYHQ